MGWLFVALLAAVHVTREESRGTVAASVLDAGRSRYLGAKAVSLLVAAATALAVSVTVLFAIRSTYAVHPTVPVDVRSTGNGPVPTGTRALAPDATWSSWSHAWAAVWHALAVLAFVALVFAVLASLFRRPLPAALAGAGVIAVFFAIAEWWHHGRWGPMGGISRLFGLDRAPFGIVDVRMWDLSARPGDLATQPFGSVVREVQVPARPTRAGPVHRPRGVDARRRRRRGGRLACVHQAELRRLRASLARQVRGELRKAANPIVAARSSPSPPYAAFSQLRSTANLSRPPRRRWM